MGGGGGLEQDWRAPTPPLKQLQSNNNKLGLILGWGREGLVRSFSETDTDAITSSFAGDWFAPKLVFNWMKTGLQLSVVHMSWGCEVIGSERPYLRLRFYVFDESEGFSVEKA